MWHDPHEQVKSPTICRMHETRPGLIEVRCESCGKLLGELPAGTRYRIKCTRCGQMNSKEMAG